MSATSEFREVCDTFMELCRTDRGGTIPIWGGVWSQVKYLLKHPIKGYVTIVREGFDAQANVGTLTPFFPLNPMLEFLSQYTESQLKSLKSLSEIHLRRMKSIITENPAFKVALPLGSAYALLEVSNKLVKVRGSSLDIVRDFLDNPFTQELMGVMLAGVILALASFVLHYIFFIAPAIARAQMLDDLLQIGLEQKRFEEEKVSGTVSTDA